MIQRVKMLPYKYVQSFYRTWGLEPEDLWVPGDFCCHFLGTTDERERLELIREVIGKMSSEPTRVVIDGHHRAAALFYLQGNLTIKTAHYEPNGNR